MANKVWSNYIQVGIEKPAQEPKSIDDMRKLIMEASRDSSLIHAAMQAADYQGLSGEDRYAMLAYRALRSYEDAFQRQLQMLNTMPMPPFIVRDEVQKEERR